MSMDTQTAAAIVLAQYRRLQRSAQRKPTEKVLEQLARFENRVYFQAAPTDESTYHVSKDWTAKGLGSALAMDQLLAWLCQEAGEDL